MGVTMIPPIENRIYRSCKHCILCVDNDRDIPYCIEGYLAPIDVYSKYHETEQIQCIKNITREEYDELTDHIIECKCHNSNSE